MELFFDIHKLFQTILISGMFISVLFVICIGYISKKINIKQPLNILRWIMITYAALGIANLIISLIAYQSNLNRITGSYWWSYLLMLICSSFLPFILLHKKLKNKKYLLLIVSILINIGWFLERLTLGAISIHRDYAPPGWKEVSWLSLFSFFPSDLIPIGLCIGLFAFLTGNMATSYNRNFILNKN